MNYRKIKIDSLLLVLLIGVLSQSGFAAGDRGIDTNVIYPADALVQNGGRVINMRTPPAGIRAAVGDGVTDDTAAFQDAYDFIKTQFLANYLNSYIIYIPNGTYLVTQSLIYRGSVASLNGFDINNVRLIGQSRAGTIIQLGNSLAAFQSNLTPEPVICYQHPSTTFNNIATQNLCENLTVNTGTGNPGAVGICFQGANSARMANVQITSGDGSGAYGIWFKVGSVQAYLKDITITGFDEGVFSLPNLENDSAFEHLTCTNQNVAAVLIGGGGMSIRDMLSSQSARHVPAVWFLQTGGSCVLLDSQLNGGAATSPAVLISGAEQSCFIRNTSISGYTVAVQNSGVTAATGSFISEYNAYTPTTLFTGQDTHTFALSVQDTPTIPWQTNMTNWINVESYRNGTNTDTVTVQAAFAAAATGSNNVVYFPHLNYDLDPAATISVPAGVTRVDFMFSNISGGVFAVDAASPDPVIFVGKTGYTPISINAARTVVTELVSGALVNLQSDSINTFVESCTNMGAGLQFCSANQNLWARSVNNENTDGIDLEVNGGVMWVLGYKTENKSATSIGAVGGGVAEILGGYVNCISPVDATIPMISCEDSSVCYIGFTNMIYTFPTVISETRSGTTQTADNTLFPVRGYPYSSNFFVPLYVGGLRPPGPFGLFSIDEDVGSVATAGVGNNYIDDTYVIDGSGSDIGGNDDSFHFLDDYWNGNGTITAYVKSVDGTDPNAKAGVMFRDAFGTSGMFVDMVVTPSQGIYMQTRQGQNWAAVTNGSNANLRPPYWVKLERTSTTTATGYTSPDGVTWTQLGTSTVDFQYTLVFAGLCVTAHNNNGTLCRSIMSNVSIQ